MDKFLGDHPLYHRDEKDGDQKQNGGCRSVVDLSLIVEHPINVVHDGENGILSEDVDEESYYLAMKRYLDMSDVQIREMSSKAIKSYAPYSMTECAEHYYDLFKGIISGKK